MILWLACAPPLEKPHVLDDPHQDWDADGATEAQGDCNDDDREQRPGRGESCDGKDNNCNGVIDEDDAIDATTWYQDLDEDGYGSDSAQREACAAPPGFVEVGGDCDDQDSARHPGVDEICNDVDDDCDGTIDAGAEGGSIWYRDGDSDGFGDDAVSIDACEAPNFYVATGGDCDDSTDEVFPGHPEVCGDALDNDCNGFASDPCLGEDLSGAQRIDGEAGGDHAGAALLGPGDLDGDGLDDVLVSATEHDASMALNAGTVYLLQGPVSPGLELDDAAWSLEGVGKNEETGATLLAGDGWLAIGGPGADVTVDEVALDRAGKVWLVPSWPASGSVEDAATLEIEGVAETERLGSALALLDGELLAIGAERAFVDDGQPGAVYLVDPSEAGTLSSDDLVRLAGVGPGAYTGSALASGDVDGDGADELLVGAWGRSTYGSAYLLSPPFDAGPVSAGQELVGEDGSDFGASVLIADLDFDGYDELVVGSPGSGEVHVPDHATLSGGEGFGAALGLEDLDGDGTPELLVGGSEGAWVVYGALSGTLELPWSETGSLGASVVGLGDIDGDGHNEIGVGAPSTGSAEEGAVLLLRGASEGLPW